MRQLSFHVLDEVPYGYCQCGCGMKTTIAKKTQAQHGYIAGEPRPFILNHSKRRILRIDGQVFRICTKCGKTKTLDQFPMKKDRSFGPSQCLPCYRKSNAAWRKQYRRTRKRGEELNRLKRTYGITYDEYEARLKQQNGVCAICGGQENRKRNTKWKTLDIDHDHATGQIRGLLCGPCNRGIGQLKHDVAILRTAISYLTKH